MNTVIIGHEKICASNGRVERGHPVRSGRLAHARYADSGGTIAPQRNGDSGGRVEREFEAADDSQKRRRRMQKIDVRQGISPACAVMLHLRACYVSKAAILTSPAP